MERRVARNARIVNQDVDRSHLGFDGRQAFADCAIIGHIEFENLDAGGFGELGGGGVIAAVIGRNRVTLGLQHLADGLADAPCSACDQCCARHFKSFSRLSFSREPACNFNTALVKRVFCAIISH